MKRLEILRTQYFSHPCPEKFKLIVSIAFRIIGVPFFGNDKNPLCEIEAFVDTGI